MLFFYIRHGDPIYDPDSLTPLGERQAEAVGKRLSMFGIDKVFSSTSNRAMQTAKPTCEMVKKELTTLDFCNESHAWSEFTVDNGRGGRCWTFHKPECLEVMTSAEIIVLGASWYEHPYFADGKFKDGVERITAESDKLFYSLGYEHIPGTGAYKAINPTDERVALFAHQGFGLAFLSCVLGIPYPIIAGHFDFGHTGMTVIEFPDRGGISVPKVLTMASDGHLYREGLPTNYNNGNHLRF